MKHLLILFAVTSCASLREGERVGPFEGMAWAVTNATTVQQLDRRFANETAALYECGDYDWLAECPEYHRAWRRYWQARRELAELENP